MIMMDLGSNDDESPTVAVHNIQDFEPNIDYYEAEMVEEVE